MMILKHTYEGGLIGYKSVSRTRFAPSFVRRAALVGKSSRFMPSFVAATT